MKNYFLIFTVLCFMISIVGCNTFRGFGEDVESGGEGIQRTVDKND